MKWAPVPSWYLREEDPYVGFFYLGAPLVQERPLFKKKFSYPNFAAIIWERPLFGSDHYWRGYGNLLRVMDLGGQMPTHFFLDVEKR